MRKLFLVLILSSVLTGCGSSPTGVSPPTSGTVSGLVTGVVGKLPTESAQVVITDLAGRPLTQPVSTDASGAFIIPEKVSAPFKVQATLTAPGAQPVLWESRYDSYRGEQLYVNVLTDLASVLSQPGSATLARSSDAATCVREAFHLPPDFDLRTDTDYGRQQFDAGAYRSTVQELGGFRQPGQPLTDTGVAILARAAGQGLSLAGEAGDGFSFGIPSDSAVSLLDSQEAELNASLERAGLLDLDSFEDFLEHGDRNANRTNILASAEHTAVKEVAGDTALSIGFDLANTALGIVAVFQATRSAQQQAVILANIQQIQAEVTAVLNEVVAANISTNYRETRGQLDVEIADISTSSQNFQAAILTQGGIPLSQVFVPSIGTLETYPARMHTQLVGGSAQSSLYQLFHQGISPTDWYSDPLYQDEKRHQLYFSQAQAALARLLMEGLTASDPPTQARFTLIEDLIDTVEQNLAVQRSSVPSQPPQSDLVYDRRNNILWRDTPIGPFTYDDAYNFAQQMNQSGYGGVRNWNVAALEDYERTFQIANPGSGETLSTLDFDYLRKSFPKLITPAGSTIYKDNQVFQLQADNVARTVSLFNRKDDKKVFDYGPGRPSKATTYLVCYNPTVDSINGPTLDDVTPTRDPGIQTWIGQPVSLTVQADGQTNGVISPNRFTATATYGVSRTNTFQMDVTDRVVWTSSNTSVLRVSNVNSTSTEFSIPHNQVLRFPIYKGQAMPTGFAGNVTVTATLPGNPAAPTAVSGSVNVTCAYPTPALDRWQIYPKKVTLSELPRTPIQLRVTGFGRFASDSLDLSILSTRLYVLAPPVDVTPKTLLPNPGNPFQNQNRFMLFQTNSPNVTVNRDDLTLNITGYSTATNNVVNVSVSSANAGFTPYVTDTMQVFLPAAPDPGPTPTPTPSPSPSPSPSPTPAPSPSPVSLTSVEFGSVDQFVSLAKDTYRYHELTAIFSDGTQADISADPEVLWTTAPVGVIQVDKGVITVLSRPGRGKTTEVTVTATYRGVKSAPSTVAVPHK